MVFTRDNLIHLLVNSLSLYPVENISIFKGIVDGQIYKFFYIFLWTFNASFVNILSFISLKLGSVFYS